MIDHGIQNVNPTLTPFAITAIIAGVSIFVFIIIAKTEDCIGWQQNQGTKQILMRIIMKTN